jgi:hypothetical protein
VARYGPDTPGDDHRSADGCLSGHQAIAAPARPARPYTQFSRPGMAAGINGTLGKPWPAPLTLQAPGAECPVMRDLGNRENQCSEASIAAGLCARA